MRYSASAGGKRRNMSGNEGLLIYRNRRTYLHREIRFRLKSAWGVVGNHEKSGLPDDVVPVASQDIIHELVKRYCIPHTCM
jgi:hypothetical protein